MADGPNGVIFSVDEESTVNGVDFVFRRFIKWNDPIVAANPDGGRTAVPREGAVIQAITEQTIDLLTPEELRIEGVRSETEVYGERTLTYDVPGTLFQTADDGDTLVAMDLDAYVRGAGEVIVDRRGWGQAKAEVEVFDSVAGEPLDYVDLEVPHQVNAKVGQTPVAQRGGERKYQIVGRTPKAGRATLLLEDAGLLAQTLPEVPDPPDEAEIPVPEFTLAASVASPLTVATATVTNDDDLEAFGVDAVEWQYAVQETEPTEDGTPFGPLTLAFGVDEIDVPEVPSGSKVWVRARSAIAATGARSDWSAWQSITLGPDDEGEGDTLPALSLTAWYDANGVVSASATGVPEIVKVYLLAGAIGGEPPTFAEVVASATVDDTPPQPFEATDLTTLGEGETVTIGAVGEDALGNRTQLALVPLSRSIDTGSGDGTPGNFVRTLVATPPLVIRDVGADFVEPEEAIPSRFYGNSSHWGALRLQGGSHRASGAGAEIALGYSLSGGPPFAEAGPVLDMSAIRFPSVGAFAPPSAGAVGDNVLFSWGVKGGDGDTVIEVGNLYLEGTVSADPPDSPDPDPPDLPQGGPLGTIIDDRNAFTLPENEGLSDGDPVTAWPDDSVFENPDAEPNSATHGQGAPTYRATGFSGGLPCVEFDGSNDGLYIPTQITGSSFTMYTVLDAVGTPGGIGIGILWDSPSGTGGKGWTVLAPSIVGDAAGGMGWNVNSQFAFPTFVNVVDTWDRSQPHLHCLRFHKESGLWQEFVDDMTTPVAQSECPPNFTTGTDIRIGLAAGLAPFPFKAGRSVTWDAAHEQSGRVQCAEALKAVWGTP